MKFSLGCELNYVVQRDTTMIINVEAQKVEGQTILRQDLSRSPFELSGVHAAPETCNRYRRLVLTPGEYVLRYDAEVETTPQLNRPGSVSEIAIADLPPAV